MWIRGWDSPQIYSGGWLDFGSLDYGLGRPIPHYVHVQTLPTPPKCRLFNIRISISLCSNYSARLQMRLRLVSRMAPPCRNTCHRSWPKTHTQQQRRLRQPNSPPTCSTLDRIRPPPTWDSFPACTSTTASAPGSTRRASFHSRARSHDVP